MKGFNIAPGGQLPPVDEFFASLHHEHGGHGGHHASLSALLAGRLRTSQSSLSDGMLFLCDAHAQNIFRSRVARSPCISVTLKA